MLVPITLRTASTALTALAMGTALLGASAPASADPAKGQPILLECDNGSSYDTVLRGNGSWTPVHDTASNTTFIPTSFSDESVVLTDADGNVVGELVESPRAKGASDKPRGTATSCTYSTTFRFVDPELGPVTGTATGDVSGFHTPIG